MRSSPLWKTGHGILFHSKPIVILYVNYTCITTIYMYSMFMMCLFGMEYEVLYLYSFIATYFCCQINPHLLYTCSYLIFGTKLSPGVEVIDPAFLLYSWTISSQSILYPAH